MQAMDNLVIAYRKARQEYEDKKEIATEAYHEYEKAEKLVRDALISSGKTKYFVDGVGQVSTVEKFSFKTPKDIQSKKLLFAYIKDTYGEEVLDSYVSINSMSLNSWAKKEMDKDPSLKIPGLESPNSDIEIRFKGDK